MKWNEIPDADKVAVYQDLLIRLHTARWTGNHVGFAQIMDRIAAFSYARTNSNFEETDEEVDNRYVETFENLKH